MSTWDNRKTGNGPGSQPGAALRGIVVLQVWARPTPSLWHPVPCVVTSMSPQQDSSGGFSWDSLSDRRQEVWRAGAASLGQEASVHLPHQHGAAYSEPHLRNWSGPYLVDRTSFLPSHRWSAWVLIIRMLHELGSSLSALVCRSLGLVCGGLWPQSPGLPPTSGFKPHASCCPGALWS